MDKLSLSLEDAAVPTSRLLAVPSPSSPPWPVAVGCFFSGGLSPVSCFESLHPMFNYYLGLGRSMGGTSELRGFPRNRSPRWRVVLGVPGWLDVTGTLLPRLGSIPRRSLIVCGARKELQTGPEKKKRGAAPLKEAQQKNTAGHPSLHHGHRFRWK